VLRAEPLEQRAVVGEVLDVEGDGLAEMAFELGFALANPAGDVEERGGAVAGEGEDGVDEGVGFDEGAIEIDAEGTRGDEAALVRGGGLGDGLGRDRSVLRYDGKTARKPCKVAYRHYTVSRIRPDIASHGVSLRGKAGRML
jgi:hypothetical protein